MTLKMTFFDCLDYNELYWQDYRYNAPLLDDYRAMYDFIHSRRTITNYLVTVRQKKEKVKIEKDKK